MIVHASQSSPLQPPEESPATQSAEQPGEFTQLLFLLLVPQTAVANQNPEASESTTAVGSSATRAAAATASQEAVSLQQAPIVSSPNFEIAPAQLDANNPPVNSASSSENAVAVAAVQLATEGEQPNAANIPPHKETAAATQPAGAGSVPVITQPTNTIQMQADIEAVLAQSAGAEKHQVFQVIPSGERQIHEATAAHAASAGSAERPPMQTANDAATNEPPAGEPMPIIDVNGASESHHTKHNLLAGEEGSGWQAGAEKKVAASSRSIDTGEGFTPFIARAQQDPAASAPSSTWRPLVDRLAGDISSHLRLGKSAAVLRLDPPELGKIKIDLLIEDGRLHARIIAEGHESKALIEAHLPDLRQALLTGKIEVADVRISQGSWNGAGDLGQGLQQQEHGRQETGRGFETAAIQSRDSEERHPRVLTRDDGRVSMWA